MIFQTFNLVFKFFIFNFQEKCFIFLIILNGTFILIFINFWMSHWVFHRLKLIFLIHALLIYEVNLISINLVTHLLICYSYNFYILFQIFLQFYQIFTIQFPIYAFGVKAKNKIKILTTIYKVIIVFQKFFLKYFSILSFYNIFLIS